MPSSIDLSNPNRRIEVGVLLMNGTTEVLDVAPIDLLNGMSKSLMDNVSPEFLPDGVKSKAIDIEFHWVSETGQGTSRLTSDMSIVPTDSFETCPPLDIVLMGAVLQQDYKPNEAELAFVRKSYEDCAAFLTICGGMMVPLQAGILKGLTCTAPRPMLPMLRETAPETKWAEKRWVRDGKAWTSGVLLNGQDLMVAFVREYWGGEGSLGEALIQMGNWPLRSVNYDE
ncbi:class I glutamine amidotransferase-like protein [Apiospora aurea]|uniref:Class I glutamine amidotransferase-like protein n=1 Tax=Apiospora aurea TaxID=335848 RepID=A0ABR1QA98_9PEZI